MTLAVCNPCVVTVSALDLPTRDRVPVWEDPPSFLTIYTDLISFNRISWACATLKCYFRETKNYVSNRYRWIVIGMDAADAYFNNR